MPNARHANGTPTPTPIATFEELLLFEAIVAVTVAVAVAVLVAVVLLANLISVELMLNAPPSVQQALVSPQHHVPSPQEVTRYVSFEAPPFCKVAIVNIRLENTDRRQLQTASFWRLTSESHMVLGKQFGDSHDLSVQ